MWDSEMLNKLLEQNPYSRPGIFFKERPTCLVVHWIGPYPMQTWEDVWSWWSKAPSHKRYGSTHAIADQGALVKAVPEDEVAWHVGGKRFTEYATRRFADWASPNYTCMGIEMTVEGSDGAISDATWDTTVNWLREQCVRLELEPSRDIITHQMVTGKRCPLWMADHPGELERMRQDVEY
jgi:N-acetylmuramoyl-L-alanine amidase